jgi:acyl-coenzyme A synthetase/AMP-(fatty) acid ligase
LPSIGIDVFAKYGITHIGLTPHLLKKLLDELPADFLKPAHLTISCAGSALSEQLAERALRSLATEVIDSFGTNETGGISFKRASVPDSFATVCRGVEVEVVDESGRPLPSGEPGRLRVRSDSLVEGYLDDPETTRRFFRDGWFYTSDIAVLDGPRRLKVIGRGDEMITTIGGKVAPSDLEASVMAHLAVGDVGVCGLADRDSVQNVFVAIAGARLGHQELLARVTRAFGKFAIGRFSIVVMPTIPRNAAGKIERARLKDAIAERLKRS